MRKWLTVILIAVVSLAALLYVVLNKDSKVVNKDNGNNDKTNIMQITEFNLEDRVVIKKDNEIYVGNNVKELENNFYDIKIINLENELVICLNKLWYESYDKDYIQDEYLAQICRELALRLGVINETQQFEYLMYKYIKDNYVKVRENEKIEKMITNEFSFEFELEDSVVKLVIRGS